MERKDFIEKALAGGTGPAGLNVLNEGSLWANNASLPALPVRRRENIDLDWRFYLGDIAGAEKPSYKDVNWRHLHLPHDWSIEGAFAEDNASGASGGYLPGGIGWYRKNLLWDPSWKDRRVYIDFDGVYMNSDVWINGHHLGHRPYGYISFRYDMTPYLQPGNNVIAVRVDNSKLPSARWYTGSGIYRHVWLNVTAPVHVGHWGTFVCTPAVSAYTAQVQIATYIINDSGQDKSLDVEQRIGTRDGRYVAHTYTSCKIKAASGNVIEQSLNIRYPSLWSPDNPHLYEVETILKEGTRILDRYHTHLGIRKLEFSPEWGFRLNGSPMIFKGTCNHGDGGGAVGSAIPDDLLYRSLKQLKEMGSNAVRTSHYPRSPEFYTFCDVLGLMVMNEAFDGWDKPKAKYDYGLYFSKWWKEDLESFIKRDRNHPCIVMWSIGNEVNGYSDARQKELADFVRNLDNTRPITQGGGYMGTNLDIAGFNGHGEERGRLEAYHKKYPNRPVIGTEMTHTLQTRGVYRTRTQYRLRDFPAPWERDKAWSAFKEKVYMIPGLSKKEVFTGIPEVYKSSYDNCFVRINVRDQFKHDAYFPFLMGSFRWTGFDYLGEVFNAWPSRGNNGGIIDLAGFPKDHYYLYQSLWSKTPMVHLLPHWTHPGKEGIRIPVVAYSNCERVELFFNDQSLGEQAMGEDLQLVWQVPYLPGKLMAVAKGAGGIKLAETIQQTAGAPFAIHVIADKYAIRANDKDVTRLEIAVVDKFGIVVPDADNLVQFEITGPGRLLGVENGDIVDMASTKTNRRKAFKGKCMGLLQAGDKSGEVVLNMTSHNLKAGECHIRII